MSKDLNFFKRYFNGKYSRSDYNAVLKGFQSEGDESDFAKQIKSHWMDFEEPENSDVNINLILLKLHRQIIRKKNNEKPVRLLHTLQRIAAILFIPLFIASSIFIFKDDIMNKDKASWAEIKCPLGVRTEFTLPDGSTGYLNSGSSLKFPASFNGAKRSVELFGEAYFDVVHDKNHPFHVKTGKLDVKVLGTTFNVVAYPDMQFEEVTLRTGKVQISNINGNKLADLNPDEQLSIDLVNNKYSKRKVTASQYTSWTNGVLSFRNERFEQVASRLSRWYNVEIELDGDELDDYIYHATFKNEPLEEVLKLMEFTAPISYRFQPRESLPDGSFTKRKVFIKFDKEKTKEFH